MNKSLMIGCLIMATVLSVHGATMCSGESASVALDLSTGTRAISASETIRYSTAWVDGAAADKLREMARIAFAGKYSPEEVDDTLCKFIRRFRAAQYKRNCVPDGPKITLSLSPRADWRMPSDM